MKYSIQVQDLVVSKIRHQIREEMIQRLQDHRFAWLYIPDTVLEDSFYAGTSAFCIEIFTNDAKNIF